MTTADERKSGPPATRNPWIPTENPIVQRAFRIGFRPGPGQYAIAWWGIFLGIALLIPFLPTLFGTQGSTEQIATWMLYSLSGFLLVVFFFGGFQRMLTAFSKERERETFDFLHLSTLPSGAVVLGFLVAGQVPGYLVACVILPILVVCAFMVGFPVSLLLASFATLVIGVLFLSILFLHLGFWAKKAAEFRGSAIVYVILGIIFSSFFVQLVDQTGAVPPAWQRAILGVPMIREYYLEGFDPGAQAVRDLPRWFGVALPRWFAVALIYLPLGAGLAATLSRSLRHRDRASWSIPVGNLWLGWMLLLGVGMWWGTTIAPHLRLITCAVISWIVIGAMLKKNVRGRARVMLDLGRVDGDWRRLCRTNEGPPLLLGLSTLAVSVLAGIIAILSPAIGLVPEGPGPDAAQVQGSIDFEGAWATPFVLVLPILGLGFLQQWMVWRSPGLRGLVAFCFGLLVILPFILHLVGTGFLPAPADSIGELISGLSPLTVIDVFARPPTETDAILVGSALVGQAIFLVLAIGGFLLCTRSAGRLATTARSLLAESESAIDEIGERDAEIVAAVAPAAPSPDDTPAR